MRKIILATLLLSALSSQLSAQTSDKPQVTNGDFETWTVDGVNLPDHWNSFQTAEGSFASTAYSSSNRQVQQSTDTRPGTTGQYSCKIWARTVFGVVAQGNLTTGCINAGSMSATGAANYNFTKTSDASKSMAFTGKPDSVYVWVKFDRKSTDDSYPTAKFSAIIHSANDYISYGLSSNDNDTNKGYVVASATAAIEANGGGWQQLKLPFTYTNNGAQAAYIQLNFSTNGYPGKGAKDDALYIDDIEMIYKAETPDPGPDPTPDPDPDPQPQPEPEPEPEPTDKVYCIQENSSKLYVAFNESYSGTAEENALCLSIVPYEFTARYDEADNTYVFTHEVGGTEWSVGQSTDASYYWNFTNASESKWTIEDAGNDLVYIKGEKGYWKTDALTKGSNLYNDASETSEKRRLFHLYISGTETYPETYADTPVLLSDDTKTYYYQIKNARVDKYACYNTSLTTYGTYKSYITEVDAGTADGTWWYFRKSDTDGALIICNKATTKQYSGVDSWTDSGSPMYIKPNPYNEGYWCLSSTTDLASNTCWDDHEYTSWFTKYYMVHYYAPTSDDYEGTSWKFYYEDGTEAEEIIKPVPTDITTVAGSQQQETKVRKYLKNGRLIIEKNGIQYNLSGRQL